VSLLERIRRLFGWGRKPVAPPPRPSSPPAPAVIVRSRRLHVGIGVNRYLDAPRSALRGCVPDPINVRRVLLARGWDGRHDLLLDYAATKRCALERIGNVLADLKAGEQALIQWSSHGTHAPDSREADSLVEALVPTDGMMDYPQNLVTVYDLAALLRGVRDGAAVLVLADACHSGLQAQEADSYRSLSSFTQEPYRRARYLAPPVALPIGAPVRTFTRGRNQVETSWTRTVLWSGCASHETSADAWIAGGYQGAATAAWIEALKRGGSLREMHAYSATVLARGGFSQSPQLLGPRALLEEPFA